MSTSQIVAVILIILSSFTLLSSAIAYIMFKISAAGFAAKGDPRSQTYRLKAMKARLLMIYSLIATFIFIEIGLQIFK